MPVTWDEAAFNAAYNLRIRWADPTDPTNVNGERIGEIVHYGKDFARYFMRGARPFEHYRKRADFVINRLSAAGLNDTHRGLVIGSGFGYLPYAMRQAGFPLWWGIDSSPYIETNYGTQNLDIATDTVFDDITNIGKVPLKNKLISLTGDWQFHVIITENVLESYLPGENAGLATLANACEAALIGTDYRRIVHIVNDIQPSHFDGETGAEILSYDPTYPLRWLTLADWATLRPTHTFVSALTGQVIVGVV